MLALNWRRVQRERVPCDKYEQIVFVDIIHETQRRRVERIQGASARRARVRSERECGGEELQRTSHKDPNGSSKCACVVHSGKLWSLSYGRVYNDIEGMGGKNTGSLLVNE